MLQARRAISRKRKISWENAIEHLEKSALIESEDEELNEEEQEQAADERDAEEQELRDAEEERQEKLTESAHRLTATENKFSDVAILITAAARVGAQRKYIRPSLPSISMTFDEVMEAKDEALHRRLFRFSSYEMIRILRGLGEDPETPLATGRRITVLRGFYCLLYYLSRPSSFIHLESFFKMKHTAVCFALKHTRLLLMPHARRLLRFDYGFLASNIDEFIEKIRAITLRKTNAFGFIDGTFRQVCRYIHLFCQLSEDATTK